MQPNPPRPRPVRSSWSNWWFYHGRLTLIIAAILGMTGGAWLLHFRAEQIRRAPSLWPPHTAEIVAAEINYEPLPPGPIVGPPERFANVRLELLVHDTTPPRTAVYDKGWRVFTTNELSSKLYPGARLEVRVSPENQSALSIHPLGP